MERTLFLIGFMGAGKSTVAKALSERLGYPVTEMDADISKKEGMTISEIFEKKGEMYFRELETRLLESFSASAPGIVSCGGGVPMREENVKAMHQSGVTILLEASPSAILERVKDSDERPLLQGRKNVEAIRALMEQREPKYRAAADLTVDTSQLSVSEVCDEILKGLEKL